MARTWRAAIYLYLAASACSAHVDSGVTSDGPGTPGQKDGGSAPVTGDAGRPDGTASHDAGTDSSTAHDGAVGPSHDAEADTAQPPPFCGDACAAVAVAMFSNTLTGEGDTPCAVLASGVASCWGNYMYSLVPKSPYSTIPVPVPGIADASAVAVGSNFMCFVLSGGAIQCQGAFANGQLGNEEGADGGTEPVTSLTDASADGATEMPAKLIGASAVVAGSVHACALIADGGTVYCWGDNAWGNLGAGIDAATSDVAVQVASLSGVISIAAGAVHTCAVIGDGGMVYCWGGSAEGQCGTGANSSNPTPIAVEGVARATAVAAGFDETCAVLEDGGVLCWGDSIDEDLGAPGAVAGGAPCAVQGLTGPATSVSVGAEHACAVVVEEDSGTVECWGGETSGELGNGTVRGAFGASAVQGVSGVASVTIGSTSTCAVLFDGGVVCWGSNRYGQLGQNAAVAIDASSGPVVLAW